MKLNYRDKIILAIVLAIAILLAGFFVLIKPKTQDIKSHKATLSERQDKKAEIERDIAKIEPLKEKIHETYVETNKLAEIFVPLSDINHPLLLDEYMQKFADENNVEIKTLELASPKVGALKYYYLPYEDIGVDLRSAADVNGDLQKQVDEESAEATALSQRTVESLFLTQYGLSINGKKEDIWNYLKAIEDYDKAVVINSVEISDYSFGKDAAEKEGTQVTSTPSEGEEGEEGEETAAATTSTEITDTSDAKIVISLYSVYNMSEPNTEE